MLMRAKLARAVLLFSVLCGLLLTALPLSAQESAPSEYQVKAAFLYNFTKFVRWPDSAFPETNSPLQIGILGDNPFGASLELAVKGKSINGHPLMVHAVNSLAEMKLCQILFICKKPKRNVTDILTALQKTSVLTVGETDDFMNAGGMIRFIMENTKVRLEINDGAAVGAGLTISSKLLNVAQKTERSG
jgi:hypothetical protein